MIRQSKLGCESWVLAEPLTALLPYCLTALLPCCLNASKHQSLKRSKGRLQVKVDLWVCGNATQHHQKLD
jgi:hypothetical protein